MPCMWKIWLQKTSNIQGDRLAMSKCGRCKRQIISGSRCANCKTKDLSDRIKKRALKEESEKQIKELKLDVTKLSPIFSNYTTYKTNYKKLFKKTPSFDDYLEALRTEKIKLAHAQALKLKREKRKRTVFPDENLGREPYLGREPEPQYQKQQETYEGCNIFGSETEFIEPTKLSNQQKLRLTFGEQHTE